MPMNSQKKHANTTSRSGGKTVSAENILVAKLKELGIDSKGLPPHVTAHLRAIVNEEGKRISDVLAAKISELEAKSCEQLRAKIARVITMKAVGKAFALPTNKPTGGAAK